MDYSTFYNRTASDGNVQAVSQPASPAATQAPGAVATQGAISGKAVSISWVGLLIALILWRIIYEFSE